VSLPERSVRRTFVIVLVCILAISIGNILFLTVKDKGEKETLSNLYSRIDSIRNVRDTLTIIEREVVMKWRIKNEKEIKYIYLSNDSVQLIIRDSLRTRYAQER